MNKKGFTLAELLIVVAIIAVLVAIAIPVFTSQLEKSKEATDLANIRSAYAEVMTKYIGDGDSSTTITVTAKQGVTGWQGESGVIVYQANGSQTTYDVTAKTSGSTYTVGITVDASGKVTPSVS